MFLTTAFIASLTLLTSPATAIFAPGSASYAGSADAFLSVYEPSGDVPFNVTIPTSSTSSYMSEGFDSIRVYLALTPPGWGTGPVCVLGDIPITQNTTEITVPAAAGPDGPYYAISWNAWQNGESLGGFEYSALEITFHDMTGNFSQYELDGMSLGSGDFPCEAIDCVRKCADEYFPGNANDTSYYGNEATNATYNCFMACPDYNKYDNTDNVVLPVDGSSSTGAVSSATVVATAAPSASSVVVSAVASATSGSAVSSGRARTSGTSSAAAAASGTASATQNSGAGMLGAGIGGIAFAVAAGALVM
ncbi:hypothetical protein G7K_3739-t1 [Saitoella complicata NRRL Y-17804]|uniref:Uncharacterized protein n=1 Tax=Saitoella complicata (strain BCRC 22490 / CBS 7301 / JCM 7358 / NBRC 10748 / NRRL Y-17804) TaxID=698492 RepID=A0A0E9NJK8_SAICN|nr:hypothetical protein G7K_3739-t1 [Saitoella complicata NRRL Y-17804]